MKLFSQSQHINFLTKVEKSYSNCQFVTYIQSPNRPLTILDFNKITKRKKKLTKIKKKNLKASPTCNGLVHVHVIWDYGLNKEKYFTNAEFLFTLSSY